jgi:hypothetical protein
MGLLEKPPESLLRRVVFDKKIRMVENGEGFTLYRIDGYLSEP